MKIHTISRDKTLYKADAIYDGKNVIVLKGSIINIKSGKKYNPPANVSALRSDNSLFDGNVLLSDVTFSSLSEAATFVTGRNANGMIVWKSENGKYVRYVLNRGGDE